MRLGAAGAVLVMSILYTPRLPAQRADPCAAARTTLAENDCLTREMGAADAELARYLAASRRAHADAPRAVAALDSAQRAWRRYRAAHCGAVYTLWEDGTIRGAMYGACMLDETRRRTHDLWAAYLTFADSTPPVLPEPR